MRNSPSTLCDKTGYGGDLRVKFNSVDRIPVLTM